MADLDIPTGYGLWQFYMTHVGIGHTAIVTLGFKVATPPYTEVQGGNALAAFATAMAPLHDAEIVYARLVTLIGNDGPLIRFEAGGSTPGSRGAQIINPPNVTYLIRKRTSLAGRRYRGRMYVPFVSTTDSTQTGALTGTASTLLSARASALTTGLIAAGPNASEFDVLHATSPLSVTPPPTTCTLLSENFVATQRRRLVRS